MYDFESYYKKYTNHLYQTLQSVDVEKVEEVVELLKKARTAGNTVFLVGNGGSAATASHFSQDLVSVGRKAGTKTFKSLSLTDNTSFITAIANDYGFENIFTAQMEELFKPNDLIIAISASGNSPNVLAAIRYAKKLGGTSIGFVGFDGGKMLLLCDYAIHVRTDKGQYGTVEDCHSILNHLVTGFILQQLSDEKSGSLGLSRDSDLSFSKSSQLGEIQ